MTQALGLLAVVLYKRPGEIGVSETFVGRSVEAILMAARTGEVGGGRFFVAPMVKVSPIRSSEQEEDAVTPAA